MNTLSTINNKIEKKLNSNITCSEENGAVKLEGEVKSWDEVVIAGQIAAKSKYRGVINDITVKGLDLPAFTKPHIVDKAIEGKKPDVMIIGGGIIGSAIARALSKWNIDILLVEKESDVAMHQSSRNDGMVHPGVNPHSGTLKAKYNVKGNEMFKQLAKELNVPFRRIGTYVLFDSFVIKEIGSAYLLSKAKKNGVKGVRRVSIKEIKKAEPHINDNIAGGIYMPTTGVCPPYEMTVALAENAVINGAVVSLNTAVLDIKKYKDNITEVVTNRGSVYPKVVINAAGVFSDKIAEMAGDRFFTIHPRKGEIALLDKNKGNLLDSVTSIVSTKLLKGNTKGGGLVKTAEGNILVGPSAYEQPYKEDYSTNRKIMNEVLDKNLPYVKGLNKGDVITYLSGTRAATYKEDFIIEKSQKVSNLIYVAGIQSPGYASSPAIAEEIERITIETLKKEMKVIKKVNFIKQRKGIPNLKELSKDERAELIQKRKEYGQIICRCEEVSKGEILDAIHSPIPALTIDAIKRRTRAGMGRCQGGFCSPLVADIIKQETGKELIDITKKGGDSYLLYKATK